jgi:hypothetical protein
MMVQTQSNQIGGGGIYHDPIAAQLEIISEKLHSLLSLKNDIAAIREAWLARPTQLTIPDPVKEEDPDSADEDRFEKSIVFGGQLKNSDGVYGIGGSVQLQVGDDVLMQIGDLEKNQIPVKLLLTKLSLAHKASWTAQTNKWAKLGGWNDPNMLRIGNRGYTYPHRVGVGPLAQNKVIAYWFDIGLNSAMVVKTCDSWKHTTRRLVGGQISATIEWLIAWYNNIRLSDLRTSHFTGGDVLIRSWLTRRIKRVKPEYPIQLWSTGAD